MKVQNGKKRVTPNNTGNTSPQKQKRPINVSYGVAMAMEHMKQDAEEQQKRPETQLTDITESAMMDVIISAEDIAKRKKSDNRRHNTNNTSGRANSNANKETVSSVGKYSSGYETSNNATASSSNGNHINGNNFAGNKKPPDSDGKTSHSSNINHLIIKPDKESNPVSTEKVRSISAKPQNNRNKKTIAGSDDARRAKIDGQKKDINGSKTGRRAGKTQSKHDKQTAKNQQKRRRKSSSPIPIYTKAMRYAAEFNKETEELARRARQAKNTARITRRAGEATVSVVKKTSKAVAWLARIAIAALKGMATALMFGGAAVVPIVLIVVVIAAFISSPFSIFAGVETSTDDNQADIVQAVAINLPESVLQYKPMVEAECESQGIPQYVDVILAIIMQESGGRVSDVMQSSESLGLPPNSLQPEESIKQGVKHFKTILESGESKGVDFDTCLQAYNFGAGFISYVESKGRTYSLELASQFSDTKANEMGIARYGDKEYVPNVYRYLQGMGNVVLSDNPIGRHLNKLYAELYTKMGAEASNLQGAEQSEIVFGTLEGDATNNAVDILAVFAVRATVGADNGDAYTLAEIGDEQLQVLSTVFWDMHSIETDMKYKTVTETDEDGNEVKKTILVKTITVSVKSTEDMAGQYNFDDSAKGALEEMLADYRSELLAFVSISPSGVDLSDEELAAIIRDLPAGDKGAAIVKAAFTRLGDPYSQDLRFQGRYIDCSGLTMWSYKQMGINIPGTAAEQGRFCVQNNVIVSRNALVPGDLVFYSDKTNGRYMNITHVAIYVGDGMIIDASYNRGQVVYRKMWGNPIMYGRPHIL